MTRRIKLIFNPHADRGHAWDLVHTLQGMIQRQSGVDWATSDYPGHATDLTLQASEAGYEVVAALGGDGTIHEIVNGLMRIPEDKRPLLAAVPLGSGNDFCANIGISQNPEQAILRVFEGEPKAVDVGRVRDNLGHVEYWDNTMGIGFGASVALHAYRIRRLRGFMMYLWAVLRTVISNYHAPGMSFVSDNEDFEQEILFLALCNGRREGGGFLTAPSAKPDDGVLNYALFESVSRPMMLRIIPEVIRGTHERFPTVHLGEFKRLKITSDAPFPLQTDGEILAGFNSRVTSVEVEVLPGAIQALV